MKSRRKNMLELDVIKTELGGVGDKLDEIRGYL